jgi:tRNA A-37 threonylcarbamoyl transferase component Bud32
VNGSLQRPRPDAERPPDALVSGESLEPDSSPGADPDSSDDETIQTLDLMEDRSALADLVPLLRERLMAVSAIAMGACVVAYGISFFAYRGPTRDVALPVHFLLDGSGVLLNLGFFVLLWRRSFPAAFLRGVDLLFFLLNGLVFVALPPLVVGSDNVNAENAALLVLVRCIFIPDSPLRTLVVCGVIWTAYLAGYAFDTGGNPLGLPGVTSDPEVLRLSFLFDNFTIGLHLTIGMVAVYSLHGLRMRALEAEQAGSYQLLEKLGEGGMGEVYRARHSQLQRPTAVKVIRADLVDSPTALRRFEREVRAASELTDPNTIAIYDFGKTAGGRFYYAMEFLEGLDLQDLVDRFGAVEPARAVFLLGQVLGSLSEAHRRGLLHRDIKPGNLFLTARGSNFDFVKVLDFGLVKPLEQAPSAEAELTAEDAVPGTPAYMAPERFYGDKDADPTSDLYSVGAVAYFLLTRRLVFDGNAAQVLIDHAKTAPVPPRQLGVGISEELERVVLQALEKRPEDRFRSAEEFREALRQTPEWGRWTRESARRWWDEHMPEASRSASQPISPAP